MVNRKKEYLRAYLAHEPLKGLCLVLSSEKGNKFFHYKKDLQYKLILRYSPILSRLSRLVRKWLKILILEFVKLCGEQLILALISWYASYTCRNSVGDLDTIFYLETKTKE